MVYYRKYRPQTIGELDSTSVRETLFAVLSKKDVPHAFLFTGPKGLGKTSTARIIAKVVNCEHTDQSQKSEKRQRHAELDSASQKEKKIPGHARNDNQVSLEPDNTCDQCVSITNGTNIDVLEIDGASNRGIDEIRDLRERVRLAPTRAKKKVYIIDEVHMLTTEAFNALLKTIEEPPAHVMFMFCTTEPHKVPATILSRCFHIAFKPATEEELVHALTRIVEGEKLSIEKDALGAIASLGEGGFRDATKLLEEVVALSDGQKITKAFVEKTLHVSGTSDFVSKLLHALAKNDVKSGISILGQVQKEGIDIKFFTSEILQTLHNMLLQKVGVSQEKQDIDFSLDEIQMLLSVFSESALQIKTSPIVVLPLELAVIGWCNNNEKLKMQNEKLSEEETNILESSGSRISGKPTMDTLKKTEQNLKVRSILYPKEKEVKAKPAAIDQPEITNHTNGKETLMENIIYKVKSYNASVAGVLRGCSIADITDESLVFETAYKFHKERLEEAKTYAIIEKTVREVTGKPLQVKVQLKK